MLLKSDISIDTPDLPRILIAVPIFNEATYLPRVLGQLTALPHDVLFVDDGSSDGTLEILDAAEARGEIATVRHEQNKGYGAALIDAFRYAGEHGYDWVITIDCDEQHDPAAIPSFVREIETDQYDLVTSSRYLQASGDDDLPPIERRAVNLVITATINELFGWNLTDTFCGFKAHRVKPTLEMNLDEHGYAFPLQLWPRVYAAGLRIKEIPVRRIYNDQNRSFGHDVRAGDLDNAKVRMGHYLAVLRDELCGLRLPKLRDATAAVAKQVLREPPTKLAGVSRESLMPEDLREVLSTGFAEAAAVPCD